MNLPILTYNNMNAKKIFCTLTYGNQLFNVLLSEEEISVLENDHIKKLEFSKEIYNSFQGEGNEQVSISNYSQEQSGPCSNIVDSSPSPCQLNPHEVYKENEPKTQRLMWTRDKINLLLDVRLDMESQFNRPTCKKTKLWQKVAEEFTRIGNTVVTAAECNDKYRNLLQTYRTNKLKKCKTGESSVTWDFYDKIDSVLGTNASTNSPTENLGNTISNNVAMTEVTNVQEEVNENKKQESKTRDMSISRYLKWKMEHKAKEREDKMKIWNEKKELKYAEIKVLQEVVQAMQSTKKRKYSTDEDRTDEDI